MTGDVAQWLERRELINPKTLGSTLWWGRVRAVFLSPRVNSRAGLCVPHDPLPVYGTHPHSLCAHVNDPISICRKRKGLTAGGIKFK